MVATNTKWILGSFKKDFVFFYLTAIVGYIALALKNYVNLIIVLAWLATYAEAVHVYSTSWRVYFDKNERTRNWLYWGYPLGFLIIFTIWFFLDIPYFKEINFYILYYHNIRQFYGLSKWYQKINNEHSPSFDLLLYFVIVPPGLMLRANSGLIPFFPKELLDILYPLYFTFCFCFIFYEGLLFFQKKTKVYRINILIMSLLTYGITIASSDLLLTYAQITLNHSITYLALLTLASQRLNLVPSKSFLKSFVIIIISSFLILTIFDLKTFNLRVSGHTLFNEDLILKLSLIFHATWSFSHYFIDAYLWTAKHPNAKIIFGTKPVTLNSAI